MILIITRHTSEVKLQVFYTPITRKLQAVRTFRKNTHRASSPIFPASHPFEKKQVINGPPLSSLQTTLRFAFAFLNQMVEPVCYSDPAAFRSAEWSCCMLSLLDNTEGAPSPPRRARRNLCPLSISDDAHRACAFWFYYFHIGLQNQFSSVQFRRALQGLFHRLTMHQFGPTHHPCDRLRLGKDKMPQ